MGNRNVKGRVKNYVLILWGERKFFKITYFSSLCLRIVFLVVRTMCHRRPDAMCTLQAAPPAAARQLPVRLPARPSRTSINLITTWLQRAIRSLRRSSVERPGHTWHTASEWPQAAEQREKTG